MRTARPRVLPLADLLRLFVPPIIWFAHFTLIYGAEALICTPQIARPGAMTSIGVAATAGALAALTGLVFMQSRRSDRSQHDVAALLRGAAVLLALLSAIGVIWTAFPLAVLRVCAPAAA